MAMTTNTRNRVSKGSRSPIASSSHLSLVLARNVAAGARSGNGSRRPLTAFPTPPVAPRRRRSEGPSSRVETPVKLRCRRNNFVQAPLGVPTQDPVRLSHFDHKPRRIRCDQTMVGAKPRAAATRQKLTADVVGSSRNKDPFVGTKGPLSVAIVQDAPWSGGVAEVSRLLVPAPRCTS